jgi:DNA (cytosine-5)-methyltransferase 1
MRDGSLIDMFCGAGLFSAGWAAHGFTPVLAVDLSKEAVSSYNLNLPPVAVAASATEWAEIPKAEILIAGPPCQGFSTLGRQDPLDVRNSLALEVPRWAAMAEPRVAIVENVPPFLASAQWAEMAAQFEALGYEIFTWILDAVDYGTPQLRRRAFTIASRIGVFDPPEPQLHVATVGEVLRRPIKADDPLHRWPEPVGIAADRIALIPALGDKRDVMRLAPHLCPPSWEKMGCHATDVWGRMDPTTPANTIRCTFQNPSKGRYLHPVENRTISLREGARLQGVPDSWSFVGRPYPVARQIGNGVPVPLAAAVAATVKSALAKADSTEARLAA